MTSDLSAIGAVQTLGLSLNFQRSAIILFSLCGQCSLVRPRSTAVMRRDWCQFGIELSQFGWTFFEYQHWTSLYRILCRQFHLFSAYFHWQLVDSELKGSQKGRFLGVQACFLEHFLQLHCLFCYHWDESCTRSQVTERPLRPIFFPLFYYQKIR